MSNPILGASRGAISHNTILYEYPCGVLDVICSSREGDWLESGWEPERVGEWSAAAHQSAPTPRCAGKKSEGDAMWRSMRRAKANIRRLALANEFEWFVTLTLDRERIDRYDGEAITKALRVWCDNMVRRHGLRYILVPELHKLKEGETRPAFHFHGFFAGDVKAVKSGHLDRGGHEVYNLPQWRYGFSTAIRIYGNYPSAVGYVCKYIGKQPDQAEALGLPLGRLLGRWYFSGGALQHPRKTYADLSYADLREKYDGVELSLPGKSIFVIQTDRESFFNE